MEVHEMVGKHIKRNYTHRGPARVVYGKGSELEEGRVVFLGDRVRDQSGKVAVFEEMTYNPATMEAGKFTDLFGCLRMYKAEFTDPGAPSGGAWGLHELRNCWRTHWGRRQCVGSSCRCATIQEKETET